METKTVSRCSVINKISGFFLGVNTRTVCILTSCPVCHSIEEIVRMRCHNHFSIFRG